MLTIMVLWSIISILRILSVNLLNKTVVRAKILILTFMMEKIIFKSFIEINFFEYIQKDYQINFHFHD